MNLTPEQFFKLGALYQEFHSYVKHLEKRLQTIEQRLAAVESKTGYTNIIDTRVTEDKIKNSATNPQVGLGNAIGNLR